jgi:hypothetical protein
LTRALAELRRLTAEIEDGCVYKGWELAEIGRKLDRESYAASDD